jgi:hypothetical protein
VLPAISEHLNVPKQLTTPETASKMPHKSLPVSLASLYRIDLKGDEQVFGGNG